MLMRHHAVRARRLLLLMIAVCASLTTSWAQTADGDPVEWPAILAGSNPNIVKSSVVDPMNAPDDIFTGGTSQSVSNIAPPNGWQWTTGTANDKTDMKNVGAALVTDPVTNAKTLYFFADRYAANGSAAVGIWIFKDPTISLNPDGTFSGQHLNGDLLIMAIPLRFPRGGTEELTALRFC